MYDIRVLSCWQAKTQTLQPIDVDPWRFLDFYYAFLSDTLSFFMFYFVISSIYNNRMSSAVMNIAALIPFGD